MKKIIFLGSSEFAIPTLEKLNEKYEVIAVYCQAPKPAKRGMQLTKCPIHLKAEELKLPIYTPKNFKDEKEVQQFKNLNADFAVVASYGNILPLSILNAPENGCLNIHPSLLPLYRGADPIRKPIINGDEETGCTIMKMDVGLDTGDLLAMEKITIYDEMDFGELHEKLADMGAYLITEVIDNFHTITPIPQENYLATYAEKIKKEDLIISWDEDAFTTDRKIRAYSPSPCMHFMFDDKRYKVIKTKPIYHKHSEQNGTTLNEHFLIACNQDTALQILKIQPEGKKPMDTEDFLRGSPVQTGILLK